MSEKFFQTTKETGVCGLNMVKYWFKAGENLGKAACNYSEGILLDSADYVDEKTIDVADRAAKRRGNLTPEKEALVADLKKKYC